MATSEWDWEATDGVGTWVGRFGGAVHRVLSDGSTKLSSFPCLDYLISAGGNGPEPLRVIYYRCPPRHTDIDRMVEMQWAAQFTVHYWMDKDDYEREVWIDHCIQDAEVFLADYAEFKAKQLSENSTAQQSDRSATEHQPPKPETK